MTKHRDRGRFRPERFAEALECRGLPSAGVMGAADVLRELGPVSRAEATRGVAATAQVATGQAVTFRFEVEAGGDYTLFVTHEGGGLTLRERMPSGASATIDAGPAGPTRAVPLVLRAGAYEVTAAARGGKPVFVDWELLLNSGVGQGAASTSTMLLAPIVVPGPAPAGATAATSAGPAAPTAAAGESSSAPVAAAAPAQLGDGLRYATGGPVGRPTLDVEVPPAAVAAAPEPALDLADAATPRIDATLLIALQEAPSVAADAADAPAAPSWVDLLSQGIAGELPDGPGVAEDGAPLIAGAEATAPADDPDEGAELSLTRLSPGIALGAVAVTVASRRRIKGDRKLAAPSPVLARPAGNSLQPTWLKIREVFARPGSPDRSRPGRVDSRAPRR